MRETTIRRLLVLVLCASGVVALWILADRSLSTPDAAVSVPAGTNSRSASSVASPVVSERSGPGTPGLGHNRPSKVPASSFGPAGRSSRSAAEPAPQSQQPPDPRPGAVRGVHVIDINHDSITIRWDAVRDDAISYYQVTLNGIGVGETAGLQLTIDWFNDDMSSYFIRVRAVDVDGHHGRRGAPLVVSRPDKPQHTSTPSPTPTPSPTHSPTHSPAHSPTPTPSPTPSPSPTTPAPTTPSATADDPMTSPPGLVTGPSQPSPTPSS